MASGAAKLAHRAERSGAWVAYGEVPTSFRKRCSGSVADPFPGGLRRRVVCTQRQ